MHLNCDRAVAFAHVAAPAGYVEGEEGSIEAFGLCVARRGEDFADRVIDFDIRDRVRARRAADGRLVNEQHIVEQLPAFEFLKRADVPLPFAALFLEAGEDHIMHQC